MQSYSITVTNDEFEFTSEQDARDLDDAVRSALEGALSVGVEQVLTGKPLFGATVEITHSNHLARFLVTVGVSPLK